MCKQQVKDKDASSYDKKVYRDCKLETWKDGFCRLHHPENVEEALACDVLRDLVRLKREGHVLQDRLVGAYLRLERPVEFEDIIKTIETAQRISDAIKRVPKPLSIDLKARSNK